MGLPEFWLEQPASETHVMRGPQIGVAFSQTRGLGHSLRIEVESKAAAIGSVPYLFQASSTQQPENESVDRKRIDNPVYQEFVPHELNSDRDAGICALLTGSCFDHHFSAVFSLCSQSEAPQAIVFDVDVADRCRGPVERLAATYDISCMAGATALKSATPSSLIWRLGAGQIELVALPPAVIAESRSSAAGMQVQIQAQIDTNSHTQRLHYRWRWTSWSDRTR